jgi:hypothetical protein
MKIGCFSLSNINRMIEGIFPVGFKHLSEYESVFTIGYFGRGNEIFCCIEGIWWQIQCHWERYSGAEPDDFEWYVDVDSITEVAPPTDVIYSHSVVHSRYREVEFFPRDASVYIGGPDGNDLAYML